MDLFKDRKKLYIIGGAAAAALVLIMVLVLVLTMGSRKSGKYDKYYAQAESAYLKRDYEKAAEYLEKALDVDRTEEAYLLLAETYCAMNDEDMAIQVLYLGYSRVGGDKISDMLEKLKLGNGSSEGGNDSDTPGTVKIAGQEVSADATSLVLSGKGLTGDDMSAIGRLTNLDSLSISSNGLTGISALASLEKLLFLQISDNSITDLSPLSGLPALKTLYLDDNPVTDFTPLYALKSLRTLSMKGVEISEEQFNELQEALPDCSIHCNVTDTEDVEQITIGGKTFPSNVTELNLGNLGISDISELRKCTELVKLDLRDNSISDISPLMDLQKLEWLCLWGNQVEDIRPLMTLKSLSYADFEGNNISDISALEYMGGLTELWLNANPVKNLRSLKLLTGLERLGLKDMELENSDLELLYGMKELRELNIEGSSISSIAFDALQEALPDCTIAHSDLVFTVRLGKKEFESTATEISAVYCDVTELAGLEEFTELRTLDLTGNAVSSIVALKPLTELESLNLYGNIVSDISALSGMSKLQTLGLQNNLISDISALSGCYGLKKLGLSGNSVSSVEALANCTALTELELDNNSLTDIAPLSALTSLKKLNLENNGITNLSALYSLTNLESLNICGNDVSLEEIEHLKIMLPGCYVVYDEPIPANSTETIEDND